MPPAAALFGLMDLIFGLLGIATAFRTGSGKRDGRREATAGRARP
jgi:hypothetical protein